MTKFNLTRSVLFLVVLLASGVAVPKIHAALVVHHAFDSISGSTFTDGAGNYDGVANGGATFDAGTAKLGAGSASINGSGYVNLGNTDALLTNIPGFTVSAWINPDMLTTGESGGDGIFANSAPNQGSVILRLDGDSPTGKLETALFTGGTWSGNPDSRPSTGAVTLNAWNHVALVWNGDVAALYLNGTASGSYDLTNGNLQRSSGTPSSLIGNTLVGHLDDLALWNESLTGDEMKSLFDVANSGDLLYDAGTFDLLKQLHDAGTGALALSNLTWTYADSLAGTAGLSGGPGAYTLILDANAGTGLIASAAPAAVPEPSSLALCALLALTLPALAHRRR